jgi:Ca2+-binding EF-hand superfamily protein
MTWDHFKKLFVLILKNQTSLFRDLYNNKSFNELNMQKHLANNENSLRECFNVYDKDESGYLDFNELTELLTELSLHKQFSRHMDPNGAFRDFCYYMWHRFDINNDGKISFDEFV